jgi:uncharacterized protein (DUF4213/DUF364 family)
MEEPIKYYLKKYGVITSNITKIATGYKYSLVMLKNGNIGVCANLLRNINVSIRDLIHPDLDNIEHRIILNAYFNALLNYSQNYDKKVDIYNGINFGKYKNIVMIGLFKPLLKKFKNDNINISIFDMMKKDGVIHISKESEYVGQADAIILSGTTIFNKTFINITENTNPDCEVFLLGPSVIMDQDMFKYRNIKGLFGSIFGKYDQRVIKVIEENGGTPQFSPYAQKCAEIH